MIERKIIKTIKKYINTDDIIVLHGARQVGKTSIMKLIYEKIKKPKYYFDLEDSRFLSVCNGGTDDILSFLRQKGIIKQESDKCFVFIDEVQYLDNPSSLLKLLCDHHKNIKLIVSGSSSFDIKKKFKDSLAGRTVSFEIFPLDFEEYLRFKGEKIDLSYRITSSALAEKLTSLYKEFSCAAAILKLPLLPKQKRKRHICSR